MAIELTTEKKILYALQFLIIICAFAYIGAITFGTMPEAGVDHSKTVLGFLLGTLLGTLLNHNWGTSKSSADKSEAAEKRLDKITEIEVKTKTEGDSNVSKTE